MTAEKIRPCPFCGCEATEIPPEAPTWPKRAECIGCTAEAMLTDWQSRISAASPRVGGKLTVQEALEEAERLILHYWQKYKSRDGYDPHDEGASDAIEAFAAWIEERLEEPTQ